MKDDQTKGKRDFSISGIKNSMFSSKNTIITIALMLAIVILVMTLPSMMNGHSKDKAQEEKEQKANNKLTAIYRNYINGDKNKAHQEMLALNYKDIPKKKIKMFI